MERYIQLEVLRKDGTQLEIPGPVAAYVERYNVPHPVINIELSTRGIDPEELIYALQKGEVSIVVDSSPTFAEFANSKEVLK